MHIHARRSTREHHVRAWWEHEPIGAQSVCSMWYVRHAVDM